jgi:hypothetical protein
MHPDAPRQPAKTKYDEYATRYIEKFPHKLGQFGKITWMEISEHSQKLLK